MNVIIIARAMIPSITLCGDEQLKLLQSKGKVNYQFVPAQKINSTYLNWADIVVFVRSEGVMELYAARLAKKHNKHCVYVLDDDLFNVPLYMSSGPYYAKEIIKENIRNIMSLCDTFLTTSPNLMKKYGDGFKNKFLIAEPSLNIIDKKEDNEKIRIGFAGSIDRTQDINQILEGALSRIIEKYGDKVEIEFFGAKPDLVNKYRLKHIPYSNSYKKYTEIVSERNWDIGLAPMPLTDFHIYKYFNKYVEYSSFGIASVFTKCEPYTFGVKDGITGLLVNNNENEWFKALERLINDSELRKKISNNCLKDAKDNYSLDKLAKDYYEKIMYGYIEKEKVLIPSMWKYKVKYFYTKVKDKVIEQGIKLPLWIVKYIYLKIKELFIE